MDFTVNKISENFYALEQKGVRAFLLVGRDNAVLVDTCFGGDILSVCQSLTHNPITLITTHSDPDHMGCHRQFTGISIYLVSNLPNTPLDYFMLAIKSKFNLSLMTGKIVSESSGLVIGLLLGGPIGLGSLIIVFAIGPMMQVLHKYTSNLFDKLTLKEELEMN